MWNPETDACEDCKTCEYFLEDFWNCQGEREKCWEYKKIDIWEDKEIDTAETIQMKGADDEDN